MLRYFLSGCQMGYDIGLGGCWPAGYYLAYSKINLEEPGKVTQPNQDTLAACGLEELFFQLCFCVSFWFWREIGFGFTYLCT
jgi:hypothetical protein